jgi:EAL domain-containing protein (putative c-di-GMP-specific phosphodiesterase class I)
MTSVAEGVENAATRWALRDCGVHLAQGFQIGLPERVELGSPQA